MAKYCDVCMELFNHQSKYGKICNRCKYIGLAVGQAKSMTKFNLNRIFKDVKDEEQYGTS